MEGIETRKENTNFLHTKTKHKVHTGGLSAGRQQLPANNAAAAAAVVVATITV